MFCENSIIEVEQVLRELCVSGTGVYEKQIILNEKYNKYLNAIQASLLNR